jgi:hypothetical protein
VLFTSLFITSFNPKERPAIAPFYPMPKQIEMLRWLEELQRTGNNGVIEKSRDMGASWIACIYAVHQFLFYPDVAIGFGSRKAELVDKRKDPDSLFEKIRMILRRLPAWVAEENRTYEDKIMLFSNLLNGSVIKGEGGDKIGRGGRTSLYFVDESAFLQNSESVAAALSANTECQIHISTPNGTSNEFYRMRSSGVFPVFRLHYCDNLRRSLEYYEKKKRELPPHRWASEYEIDYTASVEGIYIIPAWVRAAINLVDRFPAMLNPDASAIAGLDVATEGGNKNVFTIRRGAVVLSQQIWDGLDTTQTAFKVHEIMRDRRISSLIFDGDGVGAGVAGTLNSIPDKPYTVTVFHGGSTPSDRVWEGEERTSREKFRNSRAETWGIVRERFKRTYEMVEGVMAHALEDLISIPNEGDLIMQLSQPVIKYDFSGKELLESKQELRKRGISSPDRADSLVYCFGVEAPDFSWML